MTKILLVGCKGRMGNAVKAACVGTGFTVAAGVDIRADGENEYTDIADVREACEVIVDFSNHEYTENILAYASVHGIPAVICSTGHTEKELEIIDSYSSSVAIFKSGNMSLGVNVIIQLAKQAATLLGDGYDIEIVEAHHNNKLDAPSGTALMIASEIESVLPYETQRITDRTGRHEKRAKNEIGIHSIRGGTITGEHEIMFCGNGETITIKHSATSRDLFASGALKAAAFIINQPIGMYDMKNLIQAQIAVEQ